MEVLPHQVLAKICSVTNDDTIFSLACTCKSYQRAVNIAKNEIIFQRNNEVSYGLNILREAIPDFSIVPYDIYNFKNVNIIEKYIGENINCIGHTYHVSSDENVIRFTTYYFNPELLANDLMTSVRVKGDILRLTFEFHTLRSFCDNLTDGFLNSLPSDDDGYKEILSCFVPYVYFRLFPFSNIILKMQHVGDIDIKTTFVNFDNHHKSIIENLTFRRHDVVFTHAIIPDMLCANLAINTSTNSCLFQVSPSFISKGFVIVLKTNGKNIKKPYNVIKSVEITLYDKSSPSIPTISFSFDSKHLLVERLKRKGMYNLGFQLNNDCLYIPISNVNFTYASQTVFKFIFHNCNINLLADVVYFSDNMIMNTHGFGSRFYW